MALTDVDIDRITDKVAVAIQREVPPIIKRFIEAHEKQCKKADVSAIEDHKQECLKVDNATIASTLTEHIKTCPLGAKLERAKYLVIGAAFVATVYSGTKIAPMILQLLF